MTNAFLLHKKNNRVAMKILALDWLLHIAYIKFFDILIVSFYDFQNVDVVVGRNYRRANLRKVEYLFRTV